MCDCDVSFHVMVCCLIGALSVSITPHEAFHHWALTTSLRLLRMIEVDNSMLLRFSLFFFFFLLILSRVVSK